MLAIVAFAILTSTSHATEVALPTLNSMHEAVELLEVEVAAAIQVMLGQKFGDLGWPDLNAIEEEAGEELRVVDLAVSAPIEHLEDALGVPQLFYGLPLRNLN